MPLAGKQISCNYVATGFNVTGYAKVDSTGKPFTLISDTWAGSSGWVAGFTASKGSLTASWNISTYPHLTVFIPGSIKCTANWPLN